MAANRLIQGVSGARQTSVERRYEHEETGAQTLDRPFLPRGAAILVPQAAPLRGAGAPLSHVGRAAGSAAAARQRPGPHRDAGQSRCCGCRRPGQEAHRAGHPPVSGGTRRLQGRYPAQRNADAGPIRQGQRHAPGPRQGVVARAGSQPGQTVRSGREHSRLHHAVRADAGAPDHLRGPGRRQRRADRARPVRPDQRQDRRPGWPGQAHGRGAASAGAA
ncbi:hypothetical protein ACMA110817_29960 [Achromobacter marplatensis]